MASLLAHPLFWSGLLFLLLFGANLWVFFRREWEASHRAVDYAQINYPLDAPSLWHWKISDGIFYPKIIWNQRPQGWQLRVDGKSTVTIPGPIPFIKPVGAKFTGLSGTTLDSCTHHYALSPLPEGSAPDLKFSITVVAREYYRDNGMHFPKDVILMDTDIPCGKFTRHSVRSWVDDYRYIGQPALAEADRIIRDEIKIIADDSELVRMEKIIGYIRHQFTQAGGVPKNAFRWMSPLGIFKEMRQGTGKGWCTQNAQVFAFFANRAGVPTRFVFCGTVEDNQIVYDGHSWTESFLQEQNRWVYSDPQQAIIGVFDRDGRALNTADVFLLCQYGAFEGLTARIFKQWHWSNLPVEAAPDKPVNVPFTLVNHIATKQFTQHTIIKYRRPPNVEDIRDKYAMLFTSRTFAWTNLKRYLFCPDFAFSHMPTNGVSVYRLRRLLFSGLVGSGLLLAARCV